MRRELDRRSARLPLLRLLPFVLGLALLLGAAGTATAQVTSCLVTAPHDFGTAPVLWDLDPWTGAKSNARPINVTADFVGIADAGNGWLYGLTGQGISPQAQKLFLIERATGNATLIGSPGIWIPEGDLARDPTTGLLYYLAWGPLYSIDPLTAQATFIGTVTSPTGGGTTDYSYIAFDPAGNLWAIDNKVNTASSTLLRIDKSNGAVLSSVDVQPKMGVHGGYDIDPASGQHFLIDTTYGIGSGHLQELNRLLGTVASVGNPGFNLGSNSLAFCGYKPDCVNPVPGMVGWWTFDEGSGTIASNRIGSGDGVLWGGPTWTPGVVGSGLDLDGFNDDVRVPDHPFLDIGTRDLSIDLWIRTTDTKTVATLVDKRTSSSGYRGYLFFLYKGYLALQLADGGYTNYVAGSSGGTLADGFVADGEWHLIAVSIDRDDPQGIRWFIDGAEVGTRRNPTGRQGSLANTSQLVIGRQSLSSGSRLDGTLDELEIFDQAVDPSFFGMVYYAGSAGKCRNDI